MASAENISKISVANGVKSTEKGASPKKTNDIPEDLGLGIVEETCKSAAEAARNTVKELQAENKTISTGIKALVSAASKITDKLLKIEDKIEDAADKEIDTARYEKEAKQLLAEQKEYQKDIKDSEKQIALNNQAAQTAEEKAEMEDKKAEDARKEAEMKAEEEAKAVEEAQEIEANEAEKEDIEASQTKEAEDELTAETNEETVNGEAEEVSKEINAETDAAEAETTEGENEVIAEETEATDAEETFLPEEAINTPIIDETEIFEETIAPTEIATETETILSEETNNYLDTVIAENPVIKEDFIAKDFVQEIEVAEIVEAVQTYEEIGVAVDAETLVKASVTELDAMVETAVVQEVLKTTATGKKMGATANIKTKKEMKENKEAADDFQANFITLQSYYNANDVYNVAAEGFITLAAEMYTNLAQGATYDTSKLNEASSTAVNLTSAIQSDVANGAFVLQDTDSQYEEAKTEADNAIKNAKDAVGEDDKNISLNELEAEFLTVTSNYRNATADSEKQDTITSLLEIVTKANTVEENPESKINMDERLVVTL